LIGNNYYFQTIEETIPKDGSDPMVELITRDDQGVIINKKILEMDKIGKFYQNKVIHEPQNNKD
jgi:hypothetical protein